MILIRIRNLSCINVHVVYVAVLYNEDNELAAYQSTIIMLPCYISEDNIPSLCQSDSTQIEIF